MQANTGDALPEVEDLLEDQGFLVRNAHTHKLEMTKKVKAIKDISQSPKRMKSITDGLKGREPPQKRKVECNKHELVYDLHMLNQMFSFVAWLRFDVCNCFFQKLVYHAEVANKK